MAKNKKGMGTVEVVIIIAILVALIFREGLMDYAEKVMHFVFDEGRITGAFG